MQGNHADTLAAHPVYAPCVIQAKGGRYIDLNDDVLAVEAQVTTASGVSRDPPVKICPRPSASAPDIWALSGSSHELPGHIGQPISGFPDLP